MLLLFSGDIMQEHMEKKLKKTNPNPLPFFFNFFFMGNPPGE